jgi:hypothetical protein
VTLPADWLPTPPGSDANAGAMPERSQLSRPMILPQYLKTSSYDVDELKIIQGTDNIETRKKIKRFKIDAIGSVSTSN